MPCVTAPFLEQLVARRQILPDGYLDVLHGLLFRRPLGPTAGSPGTDTLYPSSLRKSATRYFMVLHDPRLGNASAYSGNANTQMTPLPCGSVMPVSRA